MEGWFNKISQASLGWLILMGKKATTMLEPQPILHTYSFQVCCTFLEQFFMLCECLRDGFQENSIYGYDFTSRRNQYSVYSFSAFIIFSFYSFNHIKYSMFSWLRLHSFTTMASVRWQCIASLSANAPFRIRQLHFEVWMPCTPAHTAINFVQWSSKQRL